VSWNHKLDNNQFIGLTMFGNGGMDPGYPGVASQTCPPGGIGTLCGGVTGIDLAQVFTSASFADGRFSLDIAPIFAVQVVKAQGLSLFESALRHRPSFRNSRFSGRH
jgi:long-chain fatty acid transport protein